MSLGSKLAIYNDNADNDLQSPADMLKVAALKLATTGGTPSTLNFYETFTDNVTWSGPWAVNQNLSIRYVRIGNICSATFEQSAKNAAVANVQAQTTTTIPTRFQPSFLGGASLMVCGVPVLDNSLTVLGTVDGSTVWQIYVSSTGLFTAAGNAGWDQFTISYHV